MVRASATPPRSPAPRDYQSQAKAVPPNNLRRLRNVKFGDRGADMDPELEYVVGCILDSRLSPEKISDETEKLGHKVSASTIIGWIYGGTRKPQNFTMTTVMRAIGFEKRWEAVG